jgi:hypothetical protein
VLNGHAPAGTQSLPGDVSKRPLFEAKHAMVRGSWVFLLPSLFFLTHDLLGASAFGTFQGLPWSFPASHWCRSPIQARNIMDNNVWAV